MPNNKQAIDTTCQKCRRDTRATGRWRKKRTQSAHSERVSEILETMESLSRGNERETQHENQNKNQTRTRTRTMSTEEIRVYRTKCTLFCMCIRTWNVVSLWVFQLFLSLVHIRCLIQLALYRLLSGLHSVKFLFVSNKNVIKTIFSPLIIHICKHAHTHNGSQHNKNNVIQAYSHMEMIQLAVAVVLVVVAVFVVCRAICTINSSCIPLRRVHFCMVYGENWMSSFRSLFITLFSSPLGLGVYMCECSICVLDSL